MFKSKTDFKAFDKKNEKVKNLDPKKSKALAKGGVNKLKGKVEQQTDLNFSFNNKVLSLQLAKLCNVGLCNVGLIITESVITVRIPEKR